MDQCFISASTVFYCTVVNVILKTVTIQTLNGRNPSTSACEVERYSDQQLWWHEGFYHPVSAVMFIGERVLTWVIKRPEKFPKVRSYHTLRCMKIHREDKIRFDPKVLQKCKGQIFKHWFSIPFIRMLFNEELILS